VAIFHHQHSISDYHSSDFLSFKDLVIGCIAEDGTGLPHLCLTCATKLEIMSLGFNFHQTLYDYETSGKDYNAQLHSINE
jgi:hypothetical protein